MRHEVALVALYDSDQAPPQIDALRVYSRDISAFPRKTFAPRGGRALAAFFSPQPRFLADTFDAALHAHIQNKIAREKYDALLVGELSMAPYAVSLAYPAKILDDIEASRFADAYRNAAGAARWRNGLTWWKYKRYVRRVAARFHALTVVSPRERALLAEIGVAGTKIHVVPNGVDCHVADTLSAPVEPYTCIYTGAVTYAANLDAMRYFCREILPPLRQAEPRVRLSITGYADQVAQNELSVDNVVSFTGYVPDVRHLVRAAAVCIVPVREGGGTRVKILEAMALGTPVVATTKGAEGLNVQHAEHLLIADTPTDFVRAILQLLQDENLRSHLTRAARERVRSEYDWSSIAQRLDNLLNPYTH